MAKLKLEMNAALHNAELMEKERDEDRHQHSPYPSTCSYESLAYNARLIVGAESP